MLFLQWFLLCLQLFFAVLVGYLLLLAVFANFASRVTALPAAARTRFLILIPAHNEERLIAATLENLLRLDYPQELYAIHVVADNCTDQTADRARQTGAIVHERFDTERRGKGYALQWLLAGLWNDQTPHDAIVILDADSILSANFLQVMDARVQRGERVIQAYYTVRDPGQSSTGSLRYAALAAVHYLRPQGRMVLGGSVGLKGNGMVFTGDLLKKFEWSASVTEDIDQHMAMILQGERVSLAPDAVVWGEMPDSLASSQTQTERWESGRLQMARKYFFPLLGASIRNLFHGKARRAYILLDAALEHLIPPFSILFAICGLFLVLDAALWLVSRIMTGGSPVLYAWNLILGAFLQTGQLAYLFAALWLARAPGYIYKSLLSAPLFVGWKIIQYGKVLFGRSQTTWVRTARNEERKGE
jgi:1,2-diacylglycerol 3-beta-glucosyltransferase